jgi:hypothetical protein
MFWKYSKKESKSLLVATLLLFSAYALVLGVAWNNVVFEEFSLTANSVGVFAGVQKNEVNSLVAQLDAREQSIEAREQALLDNRRGFDDRTLLFITLAGFGLLGLILLNFYLDTKRRRNFAPQG